MRRLLIGVLVAVSMVASVGHSNPAYGAEDGPLIVDPYTEVGAAATDGTTVVWVQLRGDEAWDIYGASLVDSRPFAIAADAGGTRSSPEIDDGTVVWVERPAGCAACDHDILAKRLGTNVLITVAATDADEVAAAISGDWVIWMRAGAEGWELVVRNLATMGEPEVIATNLVANQSPAIDGTRVVWIADTVGSDGLPNPVLLTQQIGQDDRVVVSDKASLFGGYFGGFDVGGDVVVYNLGRSAYLFRPGLGSYSLSGPFTDFVVTDGRYVFWTRTFPHQSPRALISGLDLTTQQTFHIPLPSSDDFEHPFPADFVSDVESGVLVWLHQPNLQGYHAVVCADVIDADLAPCDPGFGPDDARYFDETQHALTVPFIDFWTVSGGLPVFGYPLTEQLREANPDTGEYYTVQYFERQRFEWHPENEGTPYDVLLGRLGAQLLDMQGRDWKRFPTADPSAPNYFPETGHAISAGFDDYWHSHGLEFGDAGVTFRESLALFGYPISEPMTETNADGDTVMTQYFERAVFEYHPQNPDEWQVLLRRVGAEVLEASGG